MDDRSTVPTWMTEVLYLHIQECVNAGQVPTWMTEGHTYHERQEKRDSCRKLQTNYLPSTDVDKYILRIYIQCMDI